MNPIRVSFLGFVALLVTSCAAFRQQSDRAVTGSALSLQRPSPGEVTFTVPKPERWELANGLVVYFLRDEELPLVRATFLYKGGSYYSGDPSLSGAAGDQLRDGSVQGIHPDDLDRRLDELGATIDSSGGDETGSVSFSCLREDLDEVFKLFSRVLRAPAFDESRLALWKALMLDSIRRRKDDPETMAGMAFSDLVYGTESVYARHPTPQRVQALTGADLRRYYELFVRPNGSILALTGNVTKADFERLLGENLAAWKKNDQQLPSIPEAGQGAAPGIYVLQREFQQASVQIGHPGPRRFSADQFSLAVFSRYFGSGGFGNVLFSKIRSELGLAYDVSGGFSAGPTSGAFGVSLGTRVEQAVFAVKSVLQVIEEVRANEPDPERLGEVKAAVNQSFVFNFASPRSIVERAATKEILQYPADFDETYLANVRAVMSRDVLSAAKTRIDPKSFVVVVVGNVEPKQFLNQGTLPVFDLSFDTEPHVIGKIGESGQ